MSFAIKLLALLGSLAEMRGPGNSNPGVACLNKKVPVHDPAVEIETITMDASAAEREKSFSAFVASHRERAIRLAWQCIGGDEAAAEDVAQEAFMKAYKSLETFRADASLGTWFYTTMATSRAELRKLLPQLQQTHQRMNALLDQDTPDEATVMEQIETMATIQMKIKQERLRTMLRVRALLTPAQRTALRKKMQTRPRFGHPGRRRGGPRGGPQRFHRGFPPAGNP